MKPAWHGPPTAESVIEQVVNDRCHYAPVNVRFGSKADVTLLNFDVRFTPKFGPNADILQRSNNGNVGQQRVRA